MELTFEVIDNLIITHFNAEKITHCNIKEIRKNIEENLEDIKKSKALVLDFSGIKFIDSTSIGFLFKLQDTIERYGLNLVISSLEDNTRSIFAYTNFSNHFKIFNTLDEVVDFY